MLQTDRQTDRQTERNRVTMLYIPPSSPYVIINTGMLGEKVLRKNAAAAKTDPTMATGRQP